MKRNFILILTILFISLCLSAKANFQVNSKSDFVEKSECISDFKTFLKKFASDETYQTKYIKFPLKYSFLSDDYETTIDSLISKKEYKFIDFTQDDNAINFETGKYTIEVEKTSDGMLYKRMGYDNGILLNYEFEKINGCWYLVKVIDEST